MLSVPRLATQRSGLVPQQPLGGKEECGRRRRTRRQHASRSKHRFRNTGYKLTLIIGNASKQKNEYHRKKCNFSLSFTSFHSQPRLARTVTQTENANKSGMTKMVPGVYFSCAVGLKRKKKYCKRLFYNQTESGKFTCLPHIKTSRGRYRSKFSARASLA